jgi:hypothetical protein
MKQPQLALLALLLPLLLFASCVTTDPLAENKDSEHISYMRKLDKPCRKVASEQLRSKEFRTAHYLLSKPLGRLYQSYIVLVGASGKTGRLVLCENEMPKEPAVDKLSGKKLAVFVGDMKKLKATLAKSDIDFGPGSLSQGMYVRLEKGKDGTKTEEFWLGMDMIKEIAPDFTAAFN